MVVDEIDDIFIHKITYYYMCSKLPSWLVAKFMRSFDGDRF